MLQRYAEDQNVKKMTPRPDSSFRGIMGSKPGRGILGGRENVSGCFGGIPFWLLLPTRGGNQMTTVILGTSAQDL